MPTSREDAILDAAGLVKALVDRDEFFASAALSQGDTLEMCRVLAGWLGDALRGHPRADLVLSSFRALARPGDGWCDYDARRTSPAPTTADVPDPAATCQGASRAAIGAMLAAHLPADGNRFRQQCV